MINRHMCLAIILAGLFLGLSGYYLDVIVRIGFDEVLWLAVAGIFIAGGLAAGGLIQRYKRYSYTDFLTGLYNSRYLYICLEAEITGSRVKGMPLCLALIDVDDFKSINDQFGHVTGDEMLFQIADILQNHVRASDVVARYGGDEFAIIFPRTSLTVAYQVMENIRHHVETVYSCSGGLTLSAGVVLLQPGQDNKTFLIQADQALYRAKKRKNTVELVS